jgi:hypothetical protein
MKIQQLKMRSAFYGLMLALSLSVIPNIPEAHAATQQAQTQIQISVCQGGCITLASGNQICASSEKSPLIKQTPAANAVRNDVPQIERLRPGYHSKWL